MVIVSSRALHVFGGIILVFALGGCIPTELSGTTKEGAEVTLMFYPGGNRLDDLIIHDGINYFGTAQYQMDDPMSDIGFRLKSDERVQAECIETGENVIGEPECKQYEVYRSTWNVVPEGTKFRRPELY